MGRFIYVSLGLLVVAFSLRGSGADCPSGWSSYDKNCYKVFDELKNWNEAERFCMEQGEEGHLVSLGSIEEGNFVAKLTSENLKKPHPSNVWIGLRTQDQEKLLRVTCEGKHGPGPCGPTIIPCFINGEWVHCPTTPPPISRKCLVLSKHTEYLKWNNHDCGVTFPFVCKFLAEPDDSE